MRGVVIGKNSERAAQKSGRAVRMLAGSTTGKLATPAGYPFQVVRLRRPRGQPATGRVNGAQAKQAWAALARTVGGEVSDDPGRRLDAAGLFRQEIKHAASEGMATRAKRTRRQRQGPDVVDVRPSAEIPTEQNGLDGTHQAAPTGGNLGRRRVEPDLHDTGAAHGAGERGQARAGVIAPGDQRCCCQALDVL